MVSKLPIIWKQTVVPDLDASSAEPSRLRMSPDTAAQTTPAAQLRTTIVHVQKRFSEVVDLHNRWLAPVDTML